MPYYAAFGLRIDSDLALPDVPECAPGNDAVVRFGVVETPAVATPLGDRRYVAMDDRSVTILWDGFGAVQITDGRQIVIDRAPGVDDGFYRQVVQNIAMGVALHQRGILTLHGSAVALPNGAAGFIGWKGAGKSTAASALIARGHRLVTDDVMAIDLAGDVPTVAPGIPNMKLWPESVRAALGAEPGDLPALFATNDKRICDAGDRFVATPQPLRRIYLLAFHDDGRTDTVVEPLPIREALMALVAQSYALRFVGNRGANGVHLAHCQALARAGVVARLTRPRSLDGVADVAAAIETDLSTLRP